MVALDPEHRRASSDATTVGGFVSSVIVISAVPVQPFEEEVPETKEIIIQLLTSFVPLALLIFHQT